MSISPVRRLGLSGLIVHGVLVLLTLVSAGTLFAQWVWPADLLTFFRPHLFVASLAGLALALLARRRLAVLAAGAIVLFNLWPLAVSSVPAAPPAAAGAPTVRIMSGRWRSIGWTAFPTGRPTSTAASPPSTC
jgi:hypothetical protein